MTLLVWGSGCLLFGFAASHCIARGVVRQLLDEIEALEAELKALLNGR